MAKYDASTITGKHKAIRYFNQLLKNECTFELTKVEVKTMSQHKYIHVLTAYFASVYGCSNTEAKQIFYKQKCNKDIFVIEYTDKATGELFKYIRSVNSLSKEEASITIDNFIKWSLDVAEIRLPLSDEHRFLSECIIEIDQNERRI